jgi:hypothetical protein
MGHTEMLLAVAGLDEKTIARRGQLLSGGDWASFSVPEQVAFQFCRKHAQSPSAMTRQDFRGVEECFGRERAIDVVWWSSQCHYMTRVADAFHLPLEDENVFDGFRPPPTKERPAPGGSNQGKGP